MNELYRKSNLLKISNRKSDQFINPDFSSFFFFGVTFDRQICLELTWNLIYHIKIEFTVKTTLLIKKEEESNVMIRSL